MSTITINGHELQHRVDNLHLEPDDVIVLKIPITITREQAAALREELTRQLGTAHKILVLSYGLDIAVAVRDQVVSEYMRIRGEFEDAIRLLGGNPCKD
jgi:hypothetical protein